MPSEMVAPHPPASAWEAVLAHSFAGRERSDFTARSFSVSCCVPSPFRPCYPEVRSLAGSRMCPHSSQPLFPTLSLSALCRAGKPTVLQTLLYCRAPPGAGLCQAPPHCQSKIWEVVPNAGPHQTHAGPCQRFSSPSPHGRAEQHRSRRLRSSWYRLLGAMHFQTQTPAGDLGQLHPCLPTPKLWLALLARLGIVALHEERGLCLLLGRAAEIQLVVEEPRTPGYWCIAVQQLELARGACR